MTTHALLDCIETLVWPSVALAISSVDVVLQVQVRELLKAQEQRALTRAAPDLSHRSGRGEER